METLAVIPARGGSRGIEKKNLVAIEGKPLIAYTIEAALAARSITRLVVSTDDNEIADVARRYGAETIERPARLATDIAPTEPAVLHVLETLAQNEGYKPELTALLQATSPLRDADDIDNAVELLIRENYDSVFSVAEDHGLFWQVENSEAAPRYDYKNRPRRQDMEPLWRENGAIYITKTQTWLDEKNRLGGRIGVYRMPPEKSVDLDGPIDLELIRLLMKRRR
jgi:CMP-N,N'-diacetyllegionaminic acid synthase